MPPLRSDLSDGALIERTRGGDRAAYGELWQRHSASARTVARSYSSLDPDDLVAESFTKLYDAILAGGGPTAAFRPYLFTTIRNTAASWGRARRETNLDTLESFEDPATSESATLEALDRSTTAQAFRSLPTRWQEVLWYSEVEAMQPAQIAPLIGMSANATAALAYRAREGLRQAWIQAHLRNPDNEPECRWTIERLGSYTRGKLRSRETSRLERHLDDCAKCTIVAAEAREVGSRLALVLLPLAAGLGGATAYSGWLSHGAPAVDVALGGTGLPAWAGGSSAGSTGASGSSGGSASSGGAGGAGGGASTGTGAGAGAGAGTGAGLGAAGIAIGATVGGLVLAAAAVAAVIVVPALTTSVETSPPMAAASEAPADADAAVEAPAVTPVRPETVPPAPAIPPPPAEAELPEEAPVVAPEPEPAPPPVVGPAPEPEPEPEPDPVTFTADSAGGLVDPLFTGVAEPGAAVVVTSSDGRSWPATADDTGAWSVLATGSPAGATTYTAVQKDAGGNVSPVSTPVVVELVPPTLEVGTFGELVTAGAFGGNPGAIVDVLLRGVVLGSLTLEEGSTCRWLGFIASPGEVGVRYRIDERTGPVAAATEDPSAELDCPA